RFLGLLSPQASKELATALFRALDAPDATMASGLALLSEAGGVERFALAELVNLETQSVLVAVRGDMVVDLGSATTSRFNWPEGATWLEGEALGVESLRLALSKVAASDTHLPLVRGVAPAMEASVTMTEASSPERVAVAADPVPVTSAEAKTTSAAAMPSPGTARTAEATGVDRTPQRLDLSGLAAQTGWTLQLPDGNELDAAPQIVVGRRPWRTDPDETATYYIVAPSPLREISGKHIEFSVVGNELQARDMGSTNGTLVFTDDKAPRLLCDGRSLSLDIGDTLDLGEGFRIVVGART
ncbi:MAG: FHA domain-containing protein, partial [Demequinaceae bacterium]|nr:FHA domain-containing protein [Demequinaceae bacterium]